MKTLKRITIVMIILSFVLVALDWVKTDIILSCWVIYMLILFMLHFFLLEHEKIEGELKIYGNHQMILHNGIFFDYSFHKSFDINDLIVTGTKVKGYIEDNIFVITGTVD